MTVSSNCWFEVGICSNSDEVGPGMYAIDWPNILAQSQIVAFMPLVAGRGPAQRLWVNPDCGLKARQWSEVAPALQNMVAAAKALRAQVT